MTERPHDEQLGSLGDLPGGDRPDPLAPDVTPPAENTQPVPPIDGENPMTTTDEAATTTAATTMPTTAMPTTAMPTTAMPATAMPATPFRVEPSTPVPDDVVRAEAPTAPPSASTGYQPTPGPAWQPRPGGPALVTVRKGPRPGAILLGLASLVVAAYVLLTNVAGAVLDVRLLAPTTFGIFGAVLVLVGLAGVLSGRRR